MCRKADLKSRYHTEDLPSVSSFLNHGIHWANYLVLPPALVAKLNEHPTDNQEVAGSTPSRLATIFHGDRS